MAVLRKRQTDKGFTYDVDFTYNGKRYIKSTKTSDLKIAKRILADIEGKIARGIYNLPDHKKKDISLRVFFPEYFVHAESFKKASTIKNERVIAQTFCASLGGDQNLRSVDMRMLDWWKADLLKRVKPTTFNIHRRFIHAAFNVAVRWGYLDKNPVTALSKLRVDETRNFLSKEETGIIFEAIDKDIADPRKKHLQAINRLFRKYLEFLLNTGLRRSEAISLQIKNVDFGKKLIYVELTKGKKYRAVPLNKRAFAILFELVLTCLTTSTRRQLPTSSTI